MCIYSCPLVIRLPKAHFHAKCKLRPIDAVIALVGLHRVWGRGLPAGIAIHGRAPQGENEGLGRERLWVGVTGVMSARYSAASKNDSRWRDPKSISSHYHESTGRMECCEKKGEWAKGAETEPDNPRWKIRCGYLSLTHTHTYKTSLTHTLSLRTFLTEVIINTSWPHLSIFLLWLFHQCF